MYRIQPFMLNLKDLKADVTDLKFHMDDHYFEEIYISEVERGNVEVALTVHKSTESDFNLSFHIVGDVVVRCDRCLDDLSLHVETDETLDVCIGDHFSDDGDVIVVDEGNEILDVSWLAYEFIALKIPLRHVHAPGKCNETMMEFFGRHSTTQDNEGSNNKPIDPRWSKLSELKLKE